MDYSNGSTFNIAKSVFDAFGTKTYVVGMSRTVPTSIWDVDRCIAVDENGMEVHGDYILYVCGKLLFVNLSAPDVFFFMQVKRRYRTKQSDIFFSRLFYPVPSCIISYVTIK